MGLDLKGNPKTQPLPKLKTHPPVCLASLGTSLRECAMGVFLFDVWGEGALTGGVAPNGLGAHGDLQLACERLQHLWT